MEQKPTTEKKVRAWIEFGGPGHESEYVLNLANFGDMDNFIPDEIEISLKEELGNAWEVMNRGTRIEILHKDPYGLRNDDIVIPAIRKVLGSAYEIR